MNILVIIIMFSLLLVLVVSVCQGQCSAAMCVQREQQQSEKVAEAEKTDTTQESSVIETIKSKASFLLRFAGCVSVQGRVEVVPFVSSFQWEGSIPPSCNFVN